MKGQDLNGKREIGKTDMCVVQPQSTGGRTDVIPTQYRCCTDLIKLFFSNSLSRNPDVGSGIRWKQCRVAYG
ncbi:MAG: hypothetical protein AAF636_06860 [Pseudomonadota bacterium]